ncbi:alginate export family protein, partial [Immundisolibacter sp.]|uniref:alginate export family protein n=1 Tax=Immundisolibacter sp. TaxID=1934948 RepID=UPI0026302FBA
MHAPSVLIRAGASLAAGLSCGTAAAQAIDDALLQGKVSLDVRYRFEMVDQDRPASILDKARAQTVRTRLGWRTGLFHGLFAYGEAENVSVVGEEDYNDTYNGKTRFPVVADPEGTEVNQAYLGYQGLKGNTFRYGRQALFFDNHRFIGDVGWRQNQQTVDSFFYENKMLPGVIGSYAYVYNVNRVFGDDTPLKTFANTGDLHLTGHLVNLQWKPNPITTLTGYAYLLDFDDFDAESTVSYGLRAAGEIPLPSLKLPTLPGAPGSAILYTAEYARQSDYADNPGNFDLDYGLLEGGMRLFGVNFKVACELLEGGAVNGTRALQTPLATLHAFNGW